MPTAAKLIAAICLAVLGFAVSELIKTQMPASTAFGRFSLINAAVGFVCGWAVVGNRAGRGYAAGISNGFTGVSALVFWGLFIQSANEMVIRSMKNRYDGVAEAFAAVFELFVRLGENLINAPVIGSLILGAIVTGYLCEYAARHWR